MASTPAPPTDLAGDAARADSPSAAPAEDAAHPVEVGLFQTLPGPEPSALPAARAEPLPVINWDRYQIIQLLGRGGMGSVWKARDSRLDRTVALKFIRGDDPVLVQRFQQEARAQARIHHPNICHVYEVSVVEGRPYIAMQFVDGQTLSQAAALMSLPAKVQVIRDVAFALHEAHRLGILHRDLKPDNIMIERLADGRFHPVVMDFGLARESSENRGLTETGTIMGTPAYMSPEQARGNVHSLDRRADVYSLGATLYELLTNRPPFVGEQVVDVLLDVLSKDPPSLRAISPRLAADLDIIALKCLAKEPEHRYESARALGEDLQHYMDGDPIRGRRTSLVRRLRRSAQRHRPLVGLMMLTLLILLMLVGQLFYSRLREQQQAQAARAETTEAQYLAQEIKNIEWLMRSAYQLPQHDIRKARALVLRRIEKLEQRMLGYGQFGKALAHDALGRGYLVLQDYSKAREHLWTAITLGHETASVDYAMGVTLGKLYERALEDAQREGDVGWYRKKKSAIRSQYFPLVQTYLKKGRASDADSTNLLEGIIAYYDEDYDLTIQHARSVFDEMPWLYEAKKLEADVHRLRGQEHRQDGRYDDAQREIQQALILYESASEIGRSDPAMYEGMADLRRTQLAIDREQKKLTIERLPLALAICEKAIATAPWRSYGYIQKAWIYYYATILNREYAPNCIETARQAVSHDLDDFYGYDILGACFLISAVGKVSQGLDPTDDTKQAITNLTQSVKINPEFAQSYDKIGNVYLSTMWFKQKTGKDGYKEYLDSTYYFQKAIEINPELVQSYNNLILLMAHRLNYLLRLGKFNQADFDLAKKNYLICKNKNPSFAACALSYLDVLASKMSYDELAGNSLQEDYQELLKVHAAVGLAPGHESDLALSTMEARVVLARQWLRQGQDPTIWLQGIDQPLARCFVQTPQSGDCGQLAAQRDWLAADWAATQKRPVLPLLRHALTMATMGVEDSPRSAQARQLVAEAHLRLARAQAARPERDQHLAGGVLIAEQGLRLNPNHPELMATYGALLLQQAPRQTAAPEQRRLTAQALTTLERALILNKYLGRDYAAYLADAKAQLAVCCKKP